MLKTIDIAFVGKHSVHREQFILAALNVTKKVSVYGSRWLAPAFSKPSLFFAIKGSQCYGKKLNALHNSSRIVLSIIAKPQSSKSIQSGINMRPYEILASGAMLLSDRYEELDSELIDGHNLVLFSSIEEFQLRIRALLKNTDEIEQIAANGRKFIQNRFSYETMAEVILCKFKELSNQPK